MMTLLSLMAMLLLSRVIVLQLLLISLSQVMQVYFVTMQVMNLQTVQTTILMKKHLQNQFLFLYQVPGQTILSAEKSNLA